MNNLIFRQVSHTFHFLSFLPFYFFLPLFLIFFPNFFHHFSIISTSNTAQNGIQNLGVSSPFYRKQGGNTMGCQFLASLNYYMPPFNFLHGIPRDGMETKEVNQQKDSSSTCKKLIHHLMVRGKGFNERNQESLIIITLPHSTHNI